MAKYVDGFLLVVPKANLEAYKEMAARGAEVWKKHGALEYVESVGDDLEPKDIKVTFPKIVGAKPDEIVVFSYIVYESRAERNRINAEVMKDPMMNDPKYKDMPMPFDMNRMAFGGFEVIVEA
ncbi:MAG: DUF1428 domain-containing protein [Candidatus Pacebacteria bacterium]|jgi:alkaline phosphatase|nr:DUF1428 domain-containing protein [Candidatus Paceibacterota bacterium]